MYYTYVLRSLKFPNYHYKGFCSDLNRRLKEHNEFKTRSNKHYAPFEIVYYETFESLEEAVKREKYWKTAAGRRYLQQFLVS